MLFFMRRDQGLLNLIGGSKDFSYHISYENSTQLNSQESARQKNGGHFQKRLNNMLLKKGVLCANNHMLGRAIWDIYCSNSFLKILKLPE